MKKSNSIVRIITIHKNKINTTETHYEIDFMTFKKALSKVNPIYEFKDVKTEFYPYEWFDLRWVYEIPSYWLLLRIFRISEAKLTKQTHKTASISVLISEIIVAIKSSKELIKVIINNF
jgi:hypothetical protein